MRIKEAREFKKMTLKSNKYAVLIAFLASSLFGCSMLKEKAADVNTSANSEIRAEYEADDTGDATKRAVGCYPDYEVEGYDYSNVDVAYQLKITSGDYVEVCTMMVSEGPEAIGKGESLMGKTISFYATNTVVETLGNKVNYSDSVSITGTNSNGMSATMFNIIGSTTCSWITNGTTVGTLNMEDLLDYKYILVVDSCGRIAGAGMSPYEKSRLLGE